MSEVRILEAILRNQAATCSSEELLALVRQYYHANEKLLGEKRPAADEDDMPLDQSAAAKKPRKKTTVFHIDGTSRGHRGPVGWAVVEGRSKVTKGVVKGEFTYTEAEYIAAYEAIRIAKEIGAKDVVVHSDCAFLVDAMHSDHKPKSPFVTDLIKRTKLAMREFDSVTFKFIHKALNVAAERQACKALDEAGF